MDELPYILQLLQANFLSPTPSPDALIPDPDTGCGTEESAEEECDYFFRNLN